MWENVTQEVRDGDYQWIKEGMTKGTLVWCADGSYKRKTAPDVCGVGWVVECRETGKDLRGPFTRSRRMRLLIVRSSWAWMQYIIC